jgi:hypothetical protein
LAEPLSTLLRFIELGTFDTSSGAELLVKAGSSIRNDVDTVIDLWQSATGDPIKEVAVRVASQPRTSAQPRFLPATVATQAPQSLVTANGAARRE